MTVTQIVDSKPVDPGLAGNLAKKLNVTEDKLEEAVDMLMAGNSPALLTIAFNPSNGAIEEVAVSKMESVPENFAALATICSRMAENFNSIALQLANSKEEVKE
jgi:hypothetical protein